MEYKILACTELGAAFLRSAMRSALGISALLILVGAGSIPVAHALGDVTVTVSNGGKLKLIGDEAGNAVEIVAGVGAETVVVTGLDGTTINGSAEVMLGGVKRLAADLGKGDDMLEVRDVDFADKVNIKLKAGDDRLILHGILL